MLAWLDTQSIEPLYFSTITVAELRFGIAAMPKGQRQNTLGKRPEQNVLPLFAGRILPFDDAASKADTSLRANARATGRAVAPADSYIAAIAASHNLTIAKRDSAPFEAAGLTVINH